MTAGPTNTFSTLEEALGALSSLRSKWLESLTDEQRALFNSGVLLPPTIVLGNLGPVRPVIGSVEHVLSVAQGRPLTLQERADAYRARFPKQSFPYHTLHVEDGWLEGVFMGGRDYKNRSPLYGTFPPRMLERILAIFPEVPRHEVLHIFSGAIPKGEWTRVDINPKFDTEYVGSVENLSTLLPSGFRKTLVIGDPPYDKNQAMHYHFPMPNKAKCIVEAAKVTRPGGFLAWFDTYWPPYQKRYWRMFGAIGVLIGTNKVVRLWTLYERTATEVDESLPSERSKWRARKARGRS